MRQEKAGILLGLLFAVACGDANRPPPLGDPGPRLDAGSTPPSDSSTLDDAGSSDASATDAGDSGQDAAPVGCTRGTLTGAADIFSQADIADFAGYTRITGSLYVGTNISIAFTNVSSLQALECLEVVEGEVTILESPELVDLTGLENLESAEALKISFNSGLESLNGLTNLSLGSGGLLVRSNPALTELTDGIVALEPMGTVDILNNSSLPDCAAEALATSLGTTCSCSGNGTGTCN